MTSKSVASHENYIQVVTSLAPGPPTRILAPPPLAFKELRLLKVQVAGFHKELADTKGFSLSISTKLPLSLFLLSIRGPPPSSAAIGIGKCSSGASRTAIMATKILKATKFLMARFLDPTADYTFKRTWVSTQYRDIYVCILPLSPLYLCTYIFIFSSF